ncbi:MAG: hypothetical protein EBZ78_10485 [Verrucomicrobia bacterium]|nr:hypothetical protein [Verrucomicrobiota bacterium]
MSKEATNLTLPKQVKTKGAELARRAGMSLSTYVAQLILKEAAREQGFTRESPAFYVSAASRAKTRTKGI